MKTLNIKNSHIDYDYLDLELTDNGNNIMVNLYNLDNIHPGWLIENQLDSIIRQIDSFYQKQKGKLKKEFEILIDIIIDGRPTYMMGFLRIS